MQENSKTNKKHEDVHSLYWETYFEDLDSSIICIKVRAEWKDYSKYYKKLENLSFYLANIEKCSEIC